MPFFFLSALSPFFISLVKKKQLHATVTHWADQNISWIWPQGITLMTNLEAQSIYLPTSQSSQTLCMAVQQRSSQSGTKTRMEHPNTMCLRVTKGDGWGYWMSLWRHFTQMCPCFPPVCSSGTPQDRNYILIFTGSISSWLPSSSTAACSRAFQHWPAQATETLVLSWGAACNFTDLFLRWEKQWWIPYPKCAFLVDLHVCGIHILLHSLVGQCL